MRIIQHKSLTEKLRNDIRSLRFDLGLRALELDIVQNEANALHTQIASLRVRLHIAQRSFVEPTFRTTGVFQPTHAFVSREHVSDVVSVSFANIRHAEPVHAALLHALFDPATPATHHDRGQVSLALNALGEALIRAATAVAGPVRPLRPIRSAAAEKT